MIKSEDGRIHEGHRGRMKDKFVSHGARIFDTYELLEMLLYHVIPYKDTNPTAKLLLEKFGGLDGVLSADTEALMSVVGLGERAAELISLVGDMYELGERSADNPHSHVFDDYDMTGEYLVDYFDKNTGKNVTALLLDGGMRLLDTVDVRADSFGSAAVRSRTFIEPALRASAAVIILASAHRYGPLFLTEAERVTSKMVRDDLSSVGVRVLEHFIISGPRYMGAERTGVFRFSNDSPQLIRFLDTKARWSKK